MDFASIVRKDGEETTRLSLTMLVSRIRGIIKQRTESAVDGVLTIHHSCNTAISRFR